MGDVVHRLRDVVDRHHVGVAEVDADERQPGGQPVAQQLHQGEEVVGAVDLVHLAGLGVPDHDGRSVDAPGDRRLLAHDPLGLELGAVVGRGQVLALVEHRLVEAAAVLAGGGHRRHLVEAAHLQRLGELGGVAGPADVHRLVGRVVGGHVVDRREVEEVLDRAAVLGDPGGVDTEPVLGQVAHDRGDAVGAPASDEGVHPMSAALADEDEDLALAVVEQLGHEEPPDEACGAGHEVGHGRRLAPLGARGDAPRATPWSRRT